MSIIVDNVRAWEADIDHITRGPLAAFQEPTGTADGVAISEARLAVLSSPHVSELLGIVKALSSTASAQPILPAGRIRSLLRQSGLLVEPAGQSARGLEPEPEPGSEPESELELRSGNDLPIPGAKSALTSEVEWLLVSKATVQVYGVLLNTLLEQILPLHDEIWYWDDILGSYTRLSLYTVQTSPLRFWRWVQDMGRVVGESRALAHQWQQFYGLVRRGIAARSFADLERRLLSPVARCRADARGSQRRLRQVRQLIASGLGILIDEGLRFDLDEGVDVKDITADRGRRWKGVVERSVSLMDQVTTDVLAVDATLADFEDKVFNDVQGDPILTAASGMDADKPARLAQRLDRLLATGVPNLVANLQVVVAEDGRPSRLVRFWMPAGLLLLSSSTLLRVLSRRRADIAQWIYDAGTTARDFWFNWVIEPVAKVVGTIRHDANSEIAIMSRDSLRADRDSLERMVVEFAVDRPDLVSGQKTLSDSEIAGIRARVHEGDVTPVLRAYERGLRRPLQGAVRGDLVRSLLIQVQKTKVDLEVAISGIDALLKSQELVFGFVGLTPGVLVSVGALQYLRTVLGGRRGLRRGRRAGRCVRVLRNIDRIFCDASTDPATLNGILSYKHRGLLVCEVHVLRSVTRGLFPGDVDKEFLEDLDEVLNSKTVERQRQSLKRIRWAYGRWMR